MKECQHSSSDPEHYCFRLHRYFVNKLRSFGCPDSYLEKTADSMVRRVIDIVEGGE